MLKQRTVMVLAVSLGTALMLTPGFGSAQNQTDAVKKHMEEGTSGVSPETTHAKDKATAADQSKAMKEQAMKHHLEAGTQGVSPHATKRKKKPASAQSGAVQQHMQEGTQGVSPHALPDKPK